MRLTPSVIAGLGLMMATLTPVAAKADAKLYPYPAKANYCPAGLQPITISGVICCGVPNQSISYQQALAHPAGRHYKAKRAYRAARANCPVGTKGCTYD